jgi:hypothetical protein
MRHEIIISREEKMSKRIKVCSILLIVVAAICIVYGLQYLFIGKPMTYHLNFIGNSFEDVKDFNPKLAQLLMLSIRVEGVSFLAIGIIVLGVALKPFRHTERWIWYTVFPALLILMITLLVISIRLADVLPITASGIGILLVSTSMLIPIKDFLGKKKSPM